MIDSQGFIVDTVQSTLEIPTGQDLAYLRITTECISDKGVYYKKVQFINLTRQQDTKNKYEEEFSGFKKFSETAKQYKRTHSNKRNKLK